MGDAMDYFIVIWSVVVFVENRLQSGFQYSELEKATGFSLSHIRSIFARYTGKSLARYVLSRKIAHAAFDIIHSEESIMNISVKYGFSNPDTFTRAFKRITGLTPQDFRKRRCMVGRIKLCAGVYGVSERMVEVNNDKATVKGSTILYGVPKVGYGVYGCTPFPICLKAAANYLGEDIDYDYAMVSSGAAFRLVWDETCWNGGNVDVIFTFDDPIMVYKNGIEGIGRAFKMLCRGNWQECSDLADSSSILSNATKEDFINIGKTERPFIHRINEHAKQWLHYYRGQLFIRFGVLSFGDRKKFSSNKLADAESLLITYCKPPENISNYRFYMGRDKVKIINIGRFGLIPKILSTEMLELA